jgi:hypothetical protein
MESSDRSAIIASTVLAEEPVSGQYQAEELSTRSLHLVIILLLPRSMLYSTQLYLSLKCKVLGAVMVLFKNS